MEQKNIVVIGMGYVGIPCAVLLADVDGYNVTGVQRQSRRSGWKIDVLNSGKNPFAGEEEPGLGELIARVVEKSTFRVTDDYTVCRDADIILIDVQTPTDENHVPQYVSLREVSKYVGQYMKKGALVIIESTVAPGTTQFIVQPILEEESGMKGGEDFYLAFSYERVMPGKLIEYLVNMPRVVGGITPTSTELAVEMYGHIVKEKLYPTGCLTAELAKTIENAYRDANIAFANEMALVCESLGVNAYEIRELINARHDRHMHIPGAGVGGHCLPKDTWLLQYGVNTYGKHPASTTLVALARQINDGMPKHIVDLAAQELEKRGKELTGAKVAVLGVAYLEDSDDTRNTPALFAAIELESRGASVICHDPFVRPQELPELTITADLDEALRDADALLLVTKHKMYYNLDFAHVKELMSTPIIIDGRNVYDAAECEAAGFSYRGIGKG